jgi:3-deoxy-D-manno-octulosonic acid kinase
MPRTHVTRNNGLTNYIIYDSDLIDFSEARQLFMHQEELSTTLTGGRGGASELPFKNGTFVLRRYKRGGLIQKIHQSKYVWSGMSLTRPWREWLLLYRLYNRNLPVPQPVAARAIRQGFTYQAEILTKKIEHSQSLACVLSNGEIIDRDWRRIGACIRRFHDAAVFHADLNAHNILLDTNQAIWIIDFDRGKLNPRFPMWKVMNLKRLKRSLSKLQNQQPCSAFSLKNWKELLKGYRPPQKQGVK